MSTPVLKRQQESLLIHFTPFWPSFVNCLPDAYLQTTGHIQQDSLLVIKGSEMESTEAFKTQKQFVAQIMGLEFYNQKDQSQIQNILHKRIQRFFTTNNHIDVAEEHFKPKIEPIYCEADYTVGDTLILFGIDFITTAALKELFSVGDPKFAYQNLDASNCILKYSSADFARTAILQNLKKDSNTAFKVEQDVQTSMDQEKTTRIKPLPKQWIELKPYPFRHFYKGQKLCPHLYNDYERKLYVRYATDKEKEAGTVTLELVEELYQRCEQIWRAVAEKDKRLKRIVHLKLLQFKERKLMVQRKIRHSKSQDHIIENGGNPNYHDKSRSREARFYRFQRPQDQQATKGTNSYPEKHPKHNVGSKGKMNKQMKQHHEMAEMNELINNIQGININIEKSKKQKDEDLEELCQELEKLNFSKIKAEYIPILSKVALPSQLRRNDYRRQRFRYHEYIKKNEEMDKRTKKYSEIDLCRD